MLTFLFVLLATTAPSFDGDRADPISIQRIEPTVRRITFDLQHLPGDMPKLHGAEAALTQYDFNCAINVSYEITEKTERDGRCEVTTTIKRTRVKLTLENRIYLPNNANIPLRSHEEGHRVINERIYESAEPVAKAAAEMVMSRTWKGTGRDEDEAGKNATDAAVQALGDEYIKGTARRADRVGEFFDQITQHGTRPINVARAVQMAFDREAKGPPATQP